jgi:hypothetical protein
LPLALDELGRFIDASMQLRTILAQRFSMARGACLRMPEKKQGIQNQ